MIRKVFEAHIPVADLERAMKFYEEVIGLELGTLDPVRRIAFYWVGGPNRSMLGLWEQNDANFTPQHFAFEISPEDMDDALALLRKHGVRPYNFLNDGTDQPMVFAWMPALAIYFKDLDNNELEFIAPLQGRGRPEKGIVSLEAWNALAQTGA